MLSDKNATLLPPQNMAFGVRSASNTRLYQKRLFVLFCALQAIVNYDSGAIPASLDKIAFHCNLNAVQLGILGSLPYVALTIMSPISGYMLGQYSPKNLIGIGLIFNVICNMIMALSEKAWVLFVSRFCVGLTQASFLIYAPVWVEEFGTPAWKTCWVALLQASVPIGIDLGYLVAGILTCNNIHWAWSIGVQCVIMFPLVVIFFCVPAKYLEVPDANRAARSCLLDPEDKKSMRGARQLSLRVSVAHIGRSNVSIQKSGLLNGLFVFTIFSLCALFFVVSGMQYWCTIWLTKDFRPPGVSEDDFKKVVVPAFGTVAATAPILGVLFGGFIIDKSGGYGPDSTQQRKALRILLVFAFCAAVCGVGAGFVQAPGGFWGVVVLLWFVLFFGGAIVPGETGMMLTSIPPKSRPMGSGIGQGAYNVFGYGLGTFLPGAIISLATPSGQESGAEERLLGMRFIFFWSVFGLIGLCISYLFVPKKSEWSEFDFREEDEEENDSIEMGNEERDGESLDGTKVGVDQISENS
eukprot:GEMP01014671.1.p1 GENE.GEMP01014671.1~~GEMP01014671.1.p1  ORF type:complete len:524 (-),score=80.35 GEMP01014671.1:1284-2855(-)